nr:ATP-binding protein [Treponema denticola]
MSDIRRLPIGVQSFEDLRVKNFIYVDKTEYVSKLAAENKVFFLSRPRRFGKSLFLSTLKAYFLGKKELFKGLYIEDAEQKQAELESREEWVKYPVLYLDFTAKNYADTKALHDILNAHLREWEEEFKIEKTEEAPDGRFRNLIKRIYEKTGKQSVILVDEYDKPLLETMIINEPLNEEYRRILKGVYGVIKSCDEYIRFAFLTGVTKFSKVSIFSDLNNLRDISMLPEYDAVCGITQKEMEEVFKPEIIELGKAQNLTEAETLAKLKQKYDGYHFSESFVNVYNPFSLLNAFSRRDFRDYWFQSGTPTFLVNYLKKAHYYLPDLENNVEIDMSSLSDYRADAASPIPILFQAGYLTIKSYNPQSDLYCLGYPNNEVKFGLIRNLLPSYSDLDMTKVQRFVWQFYEKVCSGDVASFMQVISDLLANIPYSSDSKDDVRWREQNYQIAVALIFQFMGMYTQTEVYSAKGRADCVVHTEYIIYVFEFKLWSAGTAEEALAQIQEQEYYKPLRLQGKKLVLIGTSFDEEKRNIKEWKMLEISAS